MANRSAFTEEGRTRIRNFQKRVMSYLVLWVVVGLVIVVAGIFIRTRYGYKPLQRLYLGQFIRASFLSLVPRRGPSRFILLVRVIGDSSGHERFIGCTDNDVTPILDENGVQRNDPKLGPFFKLKPGLPYRYFHWRQVTLNTVEGYEWLRQNVYDGHSVQGLYWFLLVPLPVVAIVGTAASAAFDVRLNRRYEEGELQRGTRLLEPQKYAHEFGREHTGLGLPALPSSPTSKAKGLV